MRWYSLVIAGVVLLSGRAVGQSTQPASAEWATVVADFGKALVESSAANLAPLLAEDAVIDSFDSKSDAVRLLARTRGGNLLLAKAYVAPEGVAADISEAVAGSGAPAELKKLMAVGDDAAGKRANATASRWIGDLLHLKGGEPTGVLVVWGGEGGSELLFVFVKGNSRPKVTQVMFGDPQRQVK